jgi:predicted transcriptional regulator
MTTPSIRVQELRRAAAETPHHCQAPGCGRATTGAKPLCTLHVSAQAYVQELLTEIDRREAELRRVRRAGERAVDPGGPIVRELLSCLEANGPQTLQRLARFIDLDARTTRAYVRTLVRRGLLGLARSHHGSARVVQVSELEAANAFEAA